MPPAGMTRRCDACGGTGEVMEDDWLADCIVCEGTGRRPVLDSELEEEGQMNLLDGVRRVIRVQEPSTSQEQEPR